MVGVATNERVRRKASQLAVAVILTALATSGPRGHAAATSDPARTPILMELFTSEGCSSCPPVDNWVERLDAAQPIQGAQVIVLSEHVDYWDHDGWKDPFSSAAFTDRQKAYMSTLSGKDVYTPQIIVDGDQELHPSDAQQAKDGLQKAAATPMINVRIDAAALAADTLTGKVAADGTDQKHGGEVFVAITLDKTQSDVLAGENNGKQLTNVAVVKNLVKIGKLDKGKSFDQAFRIKLWPGADPANLRIVAFVQESGPGKVLGAGMTKEIERAGN
jgi:hypothetical protein